MYYNEQKEYIEVKKAEYRERSNSDADLETRKDVLRQQMSTNWSRVQYAQDAKRAANIRTLVLIGVIVALGYFLLYGLDNVDTVVEKIWK